MSPKSKQPPRRSAGSGIGTTKNTTSVGSSLLATGTSSNIVVRTSVPDSLLRHDISDEHLGMLQNAQSDLAFNLFLTALGTAIGSATSALRDLTNAYLISHPIPLDGIGLIGVVIFFGSLIAAGVSFSLARQNKSSVDELVDSIRQRTKHRFANVSTDSGHDQRQVPRA